ncbi:MAG: SLC13 family permease [Magnetococcales bacterium]|nr:SLC13 family permease [Magnetococcales bacterium]
MTDSNHGPRHKKYNSLFSFVQDNLINLVAAGIFIIIGFSVGIVAPNNEIAWVCDTLLLTVYLFAFEVVQIDVAAITVMVILGISGLIGPVLGLTGPLVDQNHLFDGFSSNAVMSIIAVMIIGAGLDKTGLMTRVAAGILKVSGRSETRVVPIISASVGVISSFMQNVGATALFLPVVSRISVRTGLPLSRLLMPMGFCAILGGTITMVGSSPLILLNDLILASNQNLPEEAKMATWDLFSVTPVGICLVLSGILYFIIAGRWVLPATKQAKNSPATGDTVMKYFQTIYGLDYAMAEVEVTSGSALVGLTMDMVERQEGIRVIAVAKYREAPYIGAGALLHETGVEEGTVLGIMGAFQNIKNFAERFDAKVNRKLKTFSEILAPNKAGIAEIVIPPGSNIIGKSARDIKLRTRLGMTLVGLHRLEQTLGEGEGIRDMPLIAGDTLVVHTSWEALHHLHQNRKFNNRNFIVLTSEYPHEEQRPHKLAWAATFFGLALSLVLFSELRLATSLLFGAVGMVLSGVLSIEEAYQAVSWKTIFLLASLIPLGLAVDSSGTAAWIASLVLVAMGEPPLWMMQLAIAALATVFTLVMSNVGATVLLVPLAINIAVSSGGDPALFALTVAIATSNSFLIPTHQVNALIMTPGGYRVIHFIRAGGVMTILFLAVMIPAMNLFL